MPPRDEQPTVQGPTPGRGSVIERGPSSEPIGGAGARAPEATRRRVGRYELLFELARGGMGTVHVGRLVGAHGVDRLVAVKLLNARGVLSDDDVAAFLREARLTARIHHPNVVQTIELGEHDGQLFLVMQLVQGVSLVRLLEQLDGGREAIEADLAVWLVAQAAAGLHAAHELAGPDGKPLGIVHRDVSPQNILLSFDGRVYVADFGIAKLADSDRVTQDGVVKGKFAYMAPEQTRAESTDRRADVFSLGIVLHETLTGRRLFAGGSPAETVRHVIERTPPDPRAIRPSIPDVYVPIVLKCLEKRREDRYATAGEVFDALRKAMHARHALADEAELAALLGRLLGAERDAQRARVARALADPEPGPAAEAPHERTQPAEPLLDDLRGPGTVTATVGPPSPAPVRRRAGVYWAAAGAALLVAGLGAARALFPGAVEAPGAAPAGAAPAGAAAEPRGPAAPAVPARVEQDPVSRDEGPPPELPAAASVNAARAAPPASSAVVRALSPRPAASAKAAPAKPSGSAAAPQPALTRGVPFDSLGD